MGYYKKLVERGQGLSVEAIAIALYINRCISYATKERICQEFDMNEKDVEEYLQELTDRVLIRKADSGEGYCSNI